MARRINKARPVIKSRVFFERGFGGVTVSAVVLGNGVPAIGGSLVVWGIVFVIKELYYEHTRPIVGGLSRS